MRGSGRAERIIARRFAPANCETALVRYVLIAKGWGTCPRRSRDASKAATFCSIEPNGTDNPRARAVDTRLSLSGPPMKR